MEDVHYPRTKFFAVEETTWVYMRGRRKRSRTQTPQGTDMAQYLANRQQFGV